MRAFLQFAVAMLAATAAEGAMTQPLRVEGGQVQGVLAEPGVVAFLGMPYAAAPIGELRWRPPVVAQHWAGLLKADHFAADCIATMPSAESRAGTQSEDCLYLNVWTPARGARDRLPVMVWIYGGAFQNGSASFARYDGAGLAKKGVLLVSMGFRHGVLGYLTHPLLTRESPHAASGNYGVLDALAAVQWVKRNIAAFGGDPGRITVFGQSSGSQMVNILTATPLAKGDFQRAIGESGAAFGERQPRLLASAERDGELYAQSLNATTLAQLRATTPQQLLDAKPPKFEPVVDGWVLPTDVHDIFSAGRQNDMPMLLGSNSDETQPQPAMTLARYNDQARERYGDWAGRFLELFPAASDATAREVARTSGIAVLGDYNISTWALLQARHGKSKVFQYRFTHVPPPSQQPAAPPRRGAYHGAEILYAFNNLHTDDRNWTAVDRAVEQRVSSYWVNFARSGDPNGPGLARWPSLQENRAQLMELGDEAHLMPMPGAALTASLDDLFYGAGGMFR